MLRAEFSIRKKFKVRFLEVLKPLAAGRLIPYLADRNAMRRSKAKRDGN